MCETRNNRRQIKFASQQNAFFPSNYFQLNQIVVFSLFHSQMSQNGLVFNFSLEERRENRSITIKNNQERRKAKQSIKSSSAWTSKFGNFLTTRREIFSFFETTETRSKSHFSRRSSAPNQMHRSRPFIFG